MNRHSALLFLATATGMLATAPVLAQEASRAAVSEDIIDTIVASAVAEESAIQDSGGPLDAIGVSAPSKGLPFRTPEFQIQTDGNSGKAIVATGFDIVSSRPSGKNKRIVSRTSLDLKVAVPFERESDNESFFDFKGIGGGTSVSAGLRFAFTKTKNVTPDDVWPIIDRARNVCVSKNVESWVRSSPQDAALLTSRQTASATYLSLFNGFLRADPTSGSFAIYRGISTKIDEDADLADQEAELKDLTAKIQQACVTDSDSDGPNGSDSGLIAEYLGEEWVSSYFSGLFVEAPIWVTGIDGTATFSNADFLDRTTFSIIDQRKTEWDISAFAGLASQDGTKSFRLSGGITRSIELPDEVELSRLNADGTQETIIGPDGPASMKTDAFATAEARFILRQSKGRVPTLAIGPKATYNIDEDDWFFELPVYLQSNKDGVLDGGIRFGYDTGKDDFGVAIFVGIPFGALNY